MIHKRKKQLSRILREPKMSGCDMWNLYGKLAAHNCAGIRKLLDTMDETSSAPMEDHEEWKNILRAMLYSFEEIRLDFPDDPYAIWFNREAGKLEEKGVPLYSEKPLPENPRGIEMVINTPDIPPSVLHAYEAYRQKIQKGLNLYAQYFLVLHD